MGTIVVSENITVDGRVQDPTGEEGFPRGGWFARATEADRRAWAEVELAEARAAEALLLGRRSYEFFAARWPAREGAWADRLNAMPKYVVSATLTDTGAWTPTTVLSGDPASSVARLRRELRGEIVVYASAPLVHTLLEHALVDELRLTVHPVLLGAGRRLFGEAGAGSPLRLVTARPLGDRLVHLTYRRAPGG